MCLFRVFINFIPDKDKEVVQDASSYKFWHGVFLSDLYEGKGKIEYELIQLK